MSADKAEIEPDVVQEESEEEMNPRLRALFLMAMLAAMLVLPFAAQAEDPACGYVTHTPNGGSSQELLPLEKCSRSSCQGIGHGPDHHKNGVVGQVDLFFCFRGV